MSMKPWLPLLLLLFVSHILEKIKSVLHLNPYYILYIVLNCLDYVFVSLTYPMPAPRRSERRLVMMRV